MNKPKDLTGQRIGRLTVMQLDPELGVNSNGKTFRRWICKCDCGNEVSIRETSLTNSKRPTMSCGCLSKEGLHHSKVDLTGQRFGRLTVLRLDPNPYVTPKGEKMRRWICLCDCGNEVAVMQTSLLYNKTPTRSCGCLRDEIHRARGEDLTGQRFGRLTVLRLDPEPDTSPKGVRYRRWICQCDCGNEVSVHQSALLYNKEPTRSCGCALVEKAAKRASIDGGNVFGNYEGTTISQIRPGLKLLKNNKSGVRGVFWEKRSQKWVAAIGFKGKCIRLGSFVKKDDAVKARKAAEEEYYAPVIAAYEEEQKNKKEN